jgi:hypothetical protein
LSCLFQDQLWVETRGSATVIRMTGTGAYRPFQRVPATVSFLNPQRTLVPGGGNWSSCPETVLRLGGISA